MQARRRPQWGERAHDRLSSGRVGQRADRDAAVQLDAGPGQALDAWREAPFYTERERAALAWTEAVTLITNGHVPDAVYEEVRQHLSEEELVNLTLAVVAINGWNRFAISFRTVPGTYQPTHR